MTPLPPWLLKKTFWPKVELIFNDQISATYGGGVLSRGLAPPRWKATYETASFLPQKGDGASSMVRWSELTSWLRSVRAQMQPTTAIVRCSLLTYPNKSYPTNWDGKATIDSVDGFEVAIIGLPDGIKVIAGDFFTVTTNGIDYMYEVATGETSNSGVSLTVTPYLNPQTGAGDVVDFENPRFKGYVMNDSKSAKFRRADHPVSFTIQQSLV